MMKKICLQSGLVYDLYEQIQQQPIKNMLACSYIKKNLYQTLEFLKGILKDGNQAVKCNNIRNGIAIYEKVNQQQFISYELYNNLGVLRALQKQYSLAIKCFNISLTIKSHQKNALINLANIKILNYQILEGIKMYQKLFKDNKTIQVQDNFNAAINFLNSFPTFYERYLIFCSKNLQSPFKEQIIGKLTYNLDKQTFIIMTNTLNILEIQELLSLFNKFFKHYHDNFFVQRKQNRNIIKSLFSKLVFEYKEHRLFHNLCLLLIGYYTQIKQPIISLYFFSLVDKLQNTKIKESYLRLHNNLKEIKRQKIIQKQQFDQEHNKSRQNIYNKFIYHVQKLQYYQNLTMFWFHDNINHLNKNEYLQQIQPPLHLKFSSQESNDQYFQLVSSKYDSFQRNRLEIIIFNKFMQNKMEQATNILKNAAQIYPKQMDIWLSIGGSILLLSCNYIRAARCFRLSLNKNSNNENSNYQLACILIISKQFNAALSFLFKTIEINPFNIDYYLTLAHVITQNCQFTYKAQYFLDKIAKNKNQSHYKIRGNIALFRLYTNNYEYSYSYLCQVLREVNKQIDQIGADLRLIYYYKAILRTFDYSDSNSKYCQLQCYLYLLLLDMDKGIQAKYIEFPKDETGRLQKDIDNFLKKLILNEQPKSLVFQQIKKFSQEHKNIIYCRIFDILIKSQKKDPSVIFNQFLIHDTQLSNHMWALQIKNKIKMSKICMFTKLIQKKQFELLQYFSIQYSCKFIKYVLDILKDNDICKICSILKRAKKYFYKSHKKCPPLCKKQNKCCFYKTIYSKLVQAQKSLESNESFSQKNQCLMIQLQSLLAEKQYQIHQLINISYRICLQLILQNNQNVKRTLFTIFINFIKDQNQQQFRQQIINLVQNDNHSQNSTIQTQSLRLDQEQLHYIQESDSDATIDLVGQQSDRNRVRYIGYQKIQLRKIQNQQSMLYQVVKFHDRNGGDRLIIYAYFIHERRNSQIQQFVFSSIILIDPFKSKIHQIAKPELERTMFRYLQALPQYFYRRDNDENIQGQPNNRIQLIIDKNRQAVYINIIQSQTPVQFTKHQLFFINLFRNGKINFMTFKQKIFKEKS